MKPLSKFLIHCEVNLLQHKGISRKYETLLFYLKEKNYNVSLSFNKFKGIRFYLGFDYLSILFKRTDNLYVRNNTRVFAIFFFLILLFFAKTRRTKVIVEIPTWPYLTNEYSGIKSFLAVINFKVNLFFYKIFNVQLFLCSPNNFEYNINFKRITNWIPNWEKHPIKQESLIYDFVYIANMNSWHDPTELIKKFISSDCTLLIISPNKLSKDLTKLIKSSNNITNKYNVSEIETSQLLNSSLIGIDTIGRKQGNYSLKSRDYLYFGLSVVYFHEDEYLAKFQYCHYFKNLNYFKPELIVKEVDFNLKFKKHEKANNILSLSILKYF